MKTRPKIGLLTSNEGHFSISEAIRETLETEFEIAVYKQNLAFNSGYKVVYRLFPTLLALPFKVKDAIFCIMVRKLFFLRYKKKLLKFFRTEQPDICITTYFMYIAAVEWYRDTTDVPFINVVTDPWTIHPVVFAAQPTLNVAFDDVSVQAGLDSDIPVTVEPWGWFVQNAFEEPYDNVRIKKALGLDPSVLTFLLAGGSEGAHKISSLLPYLMKSKQPLQIIVVCGSNRILLQQIKLQFGRHSNPHVKLYPLGFTKHLDRYMKAADLVIGKAGPNTLFEAVATRTPFFAITHISGQEDGNLEIIEKYQLGYVEEKIDRAAALLEDIRLHPEQLRAFHKQLDALARYNQASKGKLVAAMHALLADTKKTKARSTR